MILIWNYCPCIGYSCAVLNSLSITLLIFTGPGPKRARVSTGRPPAATFLGN